jgi:L-2-hydroxyglutarate oxidase LhgO
MQSDFDTVVIGAGVVGLAIARHAAQEGQSVLVLEKGPRAGLETSSRNSEVVHAGIYYPAGSLKARLCVEGRQLLYDYCAANGVEAQRVGKLIVATTPDEEPKLQTIKERGEANGVHDLAWMTPEDVAQLEPDVRCTKALFSPSSGVVDAACFMLALQGDAENAGAAFAFHSRFANGRKDQSLFVLKTLDAAGEVTDIICRFLFNCAGHGAHQVARNLENYALSALPPRFLAKGSYCSVSGKSPFRHLIYPVPVSGALGIHATIDIAGDVRLGPDITWVDNVDYDVSEDLPDIFAASVERYWPRVRERTLSPSYCGIRPKIHAPDQGFADFQIQTQESHGIPGLANLFGIESPGLTASLGLARHTFNLLNNTHKETQ